MDYGRNFWCSTRQRDAEQSHEHQGTVNVLHDLNLLGLTSAQVKQVIPQDAILQPRKLDWLVSDRVDDLIAIMNDNATFVRFPTLGSSTSIITVYGDHAVNVSRTIRSIMQLVCSTPYPDIRTRLTRRGRHVLIIGSVSGCCPSSITSFSRKPPFTIRQSNHS